MGKYQDPKFDKEAYRKRRKNKLRGQPPVTFKEVLEDLGADINKKVKKKIRVDNDKP